MSKPGKQSDAGVPIDKICAFTLLDRALILRLGRLSYFPKPKNGLFNFPETLKGCFKYLSEERAKKGRPENGTQELPIYSSMTNCEAAAGIPVALQKKAKSEGCSAFRYARVYLGPLIKHLCGSGALKAEEKKVGPRTRLDEYNAGMAEIRFKEMQDMFVDKSEVRTGIFQAEGEFFGALDRVLMSELPPALVGMREIEIRNRMSREIDTIKTVLKERFAELAAESDSLETETITDGKKK